MALEGRVVSFELGREAGRIVEETFIRRYYPLVYIGVQRISTVLGRHESRTSQL